MVRALLFDSCLDLMQDYLLSLAGAVVISEIQFFPFANKRNDAAILIGGGFALSY